MIDKNAVMERIRARRPRLSEAQVERRANIIVALAWFAIRAGEAGASIGVGALSDAASGLLKPKLRSSKN